jgi:hypothetical protein
MLITMAPRQTRHLSLVFSCDYMAHFGAMVNAYNHRQKWRMLITMALRQKTEGQEYSIKLFTTTMNVFSVIGVRVATIVLLVNWYCKGYVNKCGGFNLHL